MAQYTVKAPDGKTITLEGPEGATEQQVIAMAQQLYKPEAPSGFLKGLKDLAAGGGQAIARGIETVAEKVGYEPATEFIRKERQKYEDTIKKEEEQYQAQRKAAGETGIDWGRIGGNIANPLNYVAGAPTTLARMAGMGAIQGAATPIYNTDEYAGQLVQNVGEGALVGGIFGAGAKALGGLKNVASDLIEPMTETGRQRIMARSIQEAVPEQARPEVAAALREAPQYTTVAPTMGEAIANIPEAANLAALQARVAKTPQGAPIYAAKEAEQEAARQNVLKIAFGGSDENIADAIANRNTITADLRTTALQQANQSAVPLKAGMITDKIDAMLVNPEFRAAPLVQSSLNNVKGLVQKWANPETGVIDSRDLYTIRKELGDSIRKRAEAEGGTPALVNKLETEVKSYIDNAITASGGKGWKNYLDTYTKASEGINRMQIGQYLEGKLQTALDHESAGTFARAVEDAAQTIKKATGQPRFEKLEQIATPAQVKDTQNVLAELQRKSAYSKLAAKSTQNINLADGESIPHFLSRIATVTNYALKKVGQDANAKMNKAFAEMTNDQYAALLTALPPTKTEAFVKSIWGKLNPEVRAKVEDVFSYAPARSAVGVTGAEALRRETALPGEQIQQQPRQIAPSRPQSKAEAVNVIAQAAQAKGTPHLTGLLSGIAKVESNFDPMAKSKTSSAKGMFQFVNKTAKQYNLNDPYDVYASAGAAATYLDMLMKRYKGDQVKALAAYNQGEGTIDKGLNKAGREYAMKVLAASRNI